MTRERTSCIAVRCVVPFDGLEPKAGVCIVYQRPRTKTQITHTSAYAKHTHHTDTCGAARQRRKHEAASFTFDLVFPAQVYTFSPSYLASTAAQTTLTTTIDHTTVQFGQYACTRQRRNRNHHLKPASVARPPPTVNPNSSFLLSTHPRLRSPRRQPDPWFETSRQSEAHRDSSNQETHYISTPHRRSSTSRRNSLGGSRRALSQYRRTPIRLCDQGGL